MKRIDHAAEARKHIEWAHEQQAADGEFDFSVRDNALIAQAEASLAVAEQIRIGNVLKLNTSTAATASALYVEPVGEWDFDRPRTLRHEVAAALGVSNE